MTDAKKIVFQGERGANSHLASREVYPDYEAVPVSYTHLTLPTIYSV